MIVESEKSDADRTVETVRIRNEELRKKYEQLFLENDHRIDLDDHVREMNELKRLTGSLDCSFNLFISSNFLQMN